MEARTKHVYLNTITNLYSALLRAENSVILFPPLAGKDHLYEDLLLHEDLKKKLLADQYPNFEYLQISTKPTNTWTECFFQLFSTKKIEWDQFKVLVLERAQQKELSFTINVPENITDVELQELLDICQKIYYFDYHRIHFHLLIDMKWNELDFFTFIFPYRSLFQNVTQEKLYPDEVITHFVHFLNEFQLQKGNKSNLPKQIVDFITIQSGGFMLIAKAIFRELNSKRILSLPELKTELQNSQNYQTQVKLLYFRLTKLQRQILAAVANFQTITDQDEFWHLLNMGLIISQNGSYYIRAKALEQHFKNTDLDPNRFKLAILNSIHLSKREQKILLYLLEQKNIKIPRQNIAALLWEGNLVEKYSDWAIDKAMARIRNKIALIPELSNFSLVSIKKVGYQLLSNV